jgi:hypothetical protein
MFTLDNFKEVIDERTKIAIDKYESGNSNKSEVMAILGEISAIIIELYDRLVTTDEVLANQVWELKTTSDDYLESLFSADNLIL